MDILLLISLLMCMAASLPAPTYSHSEDAHEKRDLDALLSFRKAITSDPWRMLSNWTAENSHNICSWYGIRCRKYTTRVVAIDLHVAPIHIDVNVVEYVGGLKGNLSSLSRLSLLHRLDLSCNSFMGRIPPEFGHLKALRVLDLSWNFDMNGSIPVEFGQLKELRVLDLSCNVAINGSIPVELVLLQKLRTLDLSHNSLMGRIPAEIGQLKALRVLRLGWNMLSGSIPAELGLLQKLENLTLQGNYFSGNIPCQLGNLTHLTQLSISSINISGSIPSQIFKLPLSILYLSFNLTGSVPKAIANLTMLTHLALYNMGVNHIPQDIANLTKLTYLSLSSNKLTDNIFVTLAKLTQLTSLNLDNNMLAGNISPTLSKLSQLTSLLLYNNMLAGNILVALVNLTQLTSIYLDNNTINGSIPKAISNLKNLYILSLSNNSFMGTIPSTIGKLHLLENLYLDLNSFTGTIPSTIGKLHSLKYLNLCSNTGQIPYSLGKLKSLSQLDLHNNSFFGSIPSSINGLVSLEILDLSQNKLEGLIPTEGIYNWTSLIVFSAHSNNFSGTLPSSLANCTKLLVLNLRNNRFTGELPPYIANFGNLQVLNVGYNNLHGSVPQWITNLTKLFVLDLSNNKFSGRIPSSLDRLQGFAKNKSSQGYQYYYEMAVNIKGIEYNVSYMWDTNKIFDLSQNNITGEIPVSIGSMNSLRVLNLSGNQLEGKIPACLGEIITLEELDLAKNNLHGEIPQALSKLSMLASLNVSSNNLCGPIPRGTQFYTFTETSFQRNKCLCGFSLQPCKQKDKSKKTMARDTGSESNVKPGWLSRVNEKVSLIALGMGAGIGFGGVVAMFIAWDRARCWVLGLSPNNTRKDAVVLALGPWSSKNEVISDLFRISGLKAHSIVLRPQNPEAIGPDALFLKYMTAQGTSMDPEVYPRPTGEVYVCGMSEEVEVPDDPQQVLPRKESITMLQRVAQAVSSQLANAELQAEQACFLPCSDDGRPVIGKIPDINGAYVATGHSCWGILNAPATGASLAELIIDGHSKIVDLKPFDPARFRRATRKVSIF